MINFIFTVFVFFGSIVNTPYDNGNNHGPDKPNKETPAKVLGQDDIVL